MNWPCSQRSLMEDPNYNHIPCGDPLWFDGYWRMNCTLPCCVVPIKDETDSEWDPDATDLDTDSNACTDADDGDPDDTFCHIHTGRQYHGQYIHGGPPVYCLLYRIFIATVRLLEP